MKRKRTVSAEDRRVAVRITVEVCTKGARYVPIKRAEVDELTERLTSGVMTTLGSSAVPHAQFPVSLMKVR